MIRYLLLVVLFIFYGCNVKESPSATTSSVAITDVTKPMVGQWGVGGEAALIISLDGDRVVISTPPNDTWRMDIRDAKIVGESLHFVQENYLHNGTDHPFNGVACNSIAKLIGEDILEFGMTTKSSPEFDSSILTRIK